MNDENELQFILVDQDEPVGQVRLTLEGEDAVVSYSIAPDKRGLGYGKEIIRFNFATIANMAQPQYLQGIQGFLMLHKMP